MTIEHICLPSMYFQLLLNGRVPSGEYGEACHRQWLVNKSFRDNNPQVSQLRRRICTVWSGDSSRFDIKLWKKFVEFSNIV